MTTLHAEGTSSLALCGDSGAQPEDVAPVIEGVSCWECLSIIG